MAYRCHSEKNSHGLCCHTLKNKISKTTTTTTTKSLPQTRMPLECLIQDGDNNDCQEDGLGVKRDLKSLCEAKLSSK